MAELFAVESQLLLITQYFRNKYEVQIHKNNESNCIAYKFARSERPLYMASGDFIVIIFYGY
jgi:hypothetical protein